MLTRPAAEIRLQFISKACRLMLNLRAQRRSAVSSEHWQEFIEALQAQEQKLWQLIEASEQPIVKQNAKEALTKLLAAIKSTAEDAPMVPSRPTSRAA